jgi:hypothetical protein
MCASMTNIVTNGITICIVCILIRDSLHINSDPHNQVTITFPITGIAESMLLNTVNPQYDICDIGSTYPRNAIIISNINIIIPIVHTIIDKSNIIDRYSTLNMCTYNIVYTILVPVI